MKIFIDKKKQFIILECVLVILLLAYFLLYMRSYSEGCLNSDDSSELVLSELLSEESSILSENWYYSTELRVLNTQLIFAPLFKIFSDWNMVRTAGSFIILVIMLASVLLFSKQMHMGKYLSLMLAAVLLIPLSQDYFMIVMTRSYYAPHITISFLSLAGLLAALETKKANRRLIFSAAAAILALLAGLGGLRQMLVLYIPLFMAAVMMLFMDPTSVKVNSIKVNSPEGSVPKVNSTNVISVEDGPAIIPSAEERSVKYNSADNDSAGNNLHGRDESSSLRLLFIESIVLIVFSGIGYLINSRILSKIYSFASWNDLKFTPFSFDSLEQVLRGYLNFFGFRAGEKVFSAALINNLTCFLLILFLVMALFDCLVRRSGSLAERMLASFLFCAILVFTALYVFTDFGYADRYNLPVLVFSVPVILLYGKRCLAELKPLYAYSISALMLLLLLSCGYITYHYPYFRTENEYVKIAGALEEAGCYYGYSSYWHGNVLTELTDGNVEVHTWAPDIQTVYNVNDAYPFLQLKAHDREVPDGDLFVLLDSEQMDSFIGGKMKGADTLYQSENYTAYHFQSYDDFLAAMTAFEWDFSAEKGAYLIEGETEKEKAESDQNLRILYKGGISYGPCLLFYPGSYEVVCSGENLSGLSFDAYSSLYMENEGLLPVTEISRSGEEIRFSFVIDESVGALDNVETRFYNNKDERVRISHISICRKSVPEPG